VFDCTWLVSVACVSDALLICDNSVILVLLSAVDSDSFIVFGFTICIMFHPGSGLNFLF
jgi:hypothetical protein